MTYDLFDDDYNASTLQPYVTLPSYQELGTYADEFARAYIEPVYATDCQDVVPFDRNLSKASVEYGLGSWNDDRNLSSSADFWNVLVVTGFQPGSGEDWDPGAESPVLGKARLTANELVLYRETLRELGTDIQRTMAHEIGHTGGLVYSRVESWPPGHCGDSNCIMSEDGVGNYLCDKCLNDLRAQSSW